MNTEKKKVVMLLDNAFDPDVRVAKEAQYLFDNNWNVEIVCLDKKNTFKSHEVDNYNGIKIKRIFCRREKITKLMNKYKIVNILKPIIYFWWLIKFISQAKKYLKNEKYEMMHCHDYIMALIGVIFFKDKIIVFDMHEDYCDKKSKIKNYLIDKVVKFIQNKAKWIIHVNDFQTQKMKEKNKSKLIYLPNYPEEKIYLPIKKTNSKKVRINYIGSLRDYESLKTLGEIGKKDSDIQVSFYGWGTCFEILKKEYQNTEIQVLGKYDGITQSGEIYRNTDILYCSYKPQIENWKNAYPVKLYEALVTETPIIVTKDTVAADFVEKFSIGETMQYESEDSLNKSIRKIIQNYKQYTINIQKIKSQYNWENIVTNLEKIYRN